MKPRWKWLLTLALLAASLALGLGPGYWGQGQANPEGDLAQQLQWMSLATQQGQAGAAWELGQKLLQETQAPPEAGLTLLATAEAGLALAEQGQNQDLAKLRLFLADASRLGAWSPTAWQTLLRLEAVATAAPADPAAMQKEFLSLQEELALTPPHYPQLQAKALQLQGLLVQALAVIPGG